MPVNAISEFKSVFGAINNTNKLFSHDFTETEIVGKYEVFSG
jgi:hypothetical protein